MRRPEAAGGPLRALIVSMSFQPGIPWRVAPQQSPPPLPRPVIVSEKRLALETFFQRTATCPYLRCLTTGVQPRLSPNRRHRIALTESLESGLSGVAATSVAEETGCEFHKKAVEMPGRMEGVENLLEPAVLGSRCCGWFSTLPTAAWKSLRDARSSTAPTTTILSSHKGSLL